MSVRQGGNTIAGAVGKYPLNERNISNCITEIPQDIKLELNNGTLTLKAGSKVYVPNGVGVFDVVVIQNDLTITFTANGTQVVFVNSNGLGLQHRPIYYCNSGTSDTGSGTTFYNTNTNIITSHKSDSDIQVSFPIGIVTVLLGVPTSIDQIFNGFGYIGSTVFALPGVKGLIPDGRNADGSLKNTTTNDFTTVKTVQVNTSTAKIAMYSGGGIGSQTKNFGLNEAENYNYDTGVLTNALEVARVIVDSNAKITSFTPKTTFHAVDYSDTEYIAHQAMPSDKYVNLTVGATGSSYTAPADGYVAVRGNYNASGAFIVLANQANNLAIFSRHYNTSNYETRLFLPVSKGQSFSLSYSSITSWNYFRFIYANGSK